ncbi:hypothetical protein [Salipiger abyssi]|uniref:hypothetical protein n=1 Tax=Salipiger abyssi TaxID=1250539 RepID=UPI004059E525
MIWVSPARIDRQLGSKWPVGRARLRQLGRVLPKPVVGLLRAPVKRAEPFTIPAEHFAKTARISETGRYQRLADLMAHEDDVRASRWYDELMRELSERGAAFYKTRPLRSEAEIAGFLRDYVLGLIDSLRRNGFDAGATGFESTAVITAEGTLCKTGSGNHRFCIASLLGLPHFPLRIVGAHEDWVRDRIGMQPVLDGVLAELPEIEARHRAPEPLAAGA